MDIYIYIYIYIYYIYTFQTYSFIFLNPAIHRMGNQATHQIFDVKNKKSLNPNLYFTACFLKFL